MICSKTEFGQAKHTYHFLASFGSANEISNTKPLYLSDENEATTFVKKLPTI